MNVAWSLTTNSLLDLWEQYSKQLSIYLKETEKPETLVRPLAVVNLIWVSGSNAQIFTS